MRTKKEENKKKMLTAERKPKMQYRGAVGDNYYPHVLPSGARVVFQDKDENTDLEGLPKEERMKYLRVVLTDRVPSGEDITFLLDNSERETATNCYPLTVAKGYQYYAPTTFKKITSGMPKHLLEEHFGVSSDWIPEKEKVLLQFQSELDAKSATIDAAIIHNRKDLGGIVNKLRLINRMYNIGRLYNFISERNYPVIGDKFAQAHDPRSWDEILSRTKDAFIDFYSEVPVGKRKYPRRKRMVDTSQKEIKGKYPHLDWLKEKLGDDLVGVLVYGSAARTDDPEKYADIDNWVRVRNVRRAQQILRGTCPALYEGKIIEDRDHKSPPGSKHIGIHLFPESDDYMIKFVRFLHDSREFLDHTKVIYGEFPFTRVKKDEIFERGLSHGHIKIKTVFGALNWAYDAPQKLLGKPALFEFIAKNPRFFLQHSLNALEGLKLRDKQTLTDLLKQRGFHIPEYRPDAAYLKESVKYASLTAFKLQEEFMNSGRKPNFDFLSDDKEYDWSGDPVKFDWNKSE